eukprot:109153-Pyramimonas_sp.AAC.1
MLALALLSLTRCIRGAWGETLALARGKLSGSRRGNRGELRSHARFQAYRLLPLWNGVETGLVDQRSARRGSS